MILQVGPHHLPGVPNDKNPQNRRTAEPAKLRSFRATGRPSSFHLRIETGWPEGISHKKSPPPPVEIVGNWDENLKNSPGWVETSSEILYKYQCIKKAF